MRQDRMEPEPQTGSGHPDFELEGGGRHPVERNPEAIRQNIRQTRGEMDGTFDELTDRLSVGRIAEDLWQRVRSEGGDVGHVIQEHPIPVALMGLGLGWLAIEQATGRSASTHSRGGRPHRERVRHPRHPSHDYETSRQKEGNGETNGHDSEGLSERFSEMSDRMSEKTSEAGEKIQHMGHRAREQAQVARRGIRDMMEENPLVMGGIVFGIGLASGLSAPSTRFEDEQVGEISDELKHDVGEMGKRGAERVREAGQAVAGAALEESRTQLDEAKEETRRRSDESDRDRTGDGPTEPGSRGR